MLRVLIADDSPRKVDAVCEVLRSFVAEENLVIEVARTATDATQWMTKEHFDLLIVDLNLPVRRGEAPRANGWETIMAQMRRPGGAMKPGHIVGLTAFDELKTQYHKHFEDALWHIVKYDETSQEWAEKLGGKLVYIAEEVFRRDAPDGAVEIGILTALEAVELEAVLDLPGKWKERTFKGDSTIYRSGKFSRSGKCLTVVAAAAADVGMPGTAVLAMKMIERFRPKYLAMVGIAAGVEGSFGDILVADQSWDYGSGKITATESGKSGFAPAPAPLSLDPVLKARFAQFRLDGAMLARIAHGWKGNRPTTELSARIGPVASGASVVANRTTIEDIVAHNRKVIGVEMETFAVFLAARHCKEPRPLALSAKSVCDFGDPAKGDDYQRYAAYTSARFLYEFSLEHLADQRISRKKTRGRGESRRRIGDPTGRRGEPRVIPDRG